VVTGYTQPGDRYFGSLHVQNAPDVPAANWNDQKAVLTGYTQPGNKYFATRQRLAYHPRDKTFQPEIAVSAGSGGASTQTAPPPPPQPEQSQASSSGGAKSSKEQELEAFEKEYLVRYAKQQEEAAKKREAKKQTQASGASKKGAMPKGF